eukprot:9273110-Alexandrium_andersonii.AAC.1
MLILRSRLRLSPFPASMSVTPRPAIARGHSATPINCREDASNLVEQRLGERFDLRRAPPV